MQKRSRFFRRVKYEAWKSIHFRVEQIQEDSHMSSHTYSTLWKRAFVDVSQKLVSTGILLYEINRQRPWKRCSLPESVTSNIILAPIRF